MFGSRLDLVGDAGAIVDYNPWSVNPQTFNHAGMKRPLAAIQKDLAINLREARQRIGLSQEALALSADVDRTYVSQIERGVGNPSIAVLTRLASSMGLDVSELLRKGR